MLWINGQFSEDNKLSAFDRGFLLGDGLFETFIKKDGRIPFFKAHMARLFSSLKRLDLFLSYDEEYFENVFDKFPDNNVIRLTVSRGASKERGLWPVDSVPFVCAQSYPLKPAETAISISTISFPKNEKSPLVGIKSLNYLEAILAKKEVVEKNCDDGVFLNTQGHVCEAITANLFWVKSGQLYTPPLSVGALPGVTRQVILGREKVEERKVLLDELYNVDEIFLTNAVQGIRSVIQLDNVTYTKDAPVTNNVRRLYENAISTC